MKITNKQVIPGVLVAAAIVSGATYLTISNLNTPVAQVAYAYTSTENPVDPATAADSYVVNIPDANLKKALNAILTQLNPFLPARADDAPITAGDLKSPVTLNLDAKSITNLEGAQFLVNARTISLASNQITNVAPLAELTRLRVLTLSSNRLTGSEFAVLKNTPVLETLMTDRNNVLNLQDFLNSGFARLRRSSTFSDQIHSINTGNNPLIANPVRGINGEVIPVTETATVKNANADGTLNPNGAYIKLVDTYGNGTVNVTWAKNFTYLNVTNRLFSGTITVRYTLPARDTVAPTFSPASPAKITSRKGVAININTLPQPTTLVVRALMLLA